MSSVKNLPRVVGNVVEAVRGVPVALTNRQQVTRLYRKSLRLALSWAIDREVFYGVAEDIRQRFDSKMGLEEGSKDAEDAKAEARRLLDEYTHPDPYIVPYMPGGSLFMRNSPPPLDLCFPDGIPDDVSRREVHIDFSNPHDDEAPPLFLTDSANKTYERLSNEYSDEDFPAAGDQFEHEDPFSK